MLKSILNYLQLSCKPYIDMLGPRFFKQHSQEKLNAGMIGVNIGVPVPREPSEAQGFS